MKTATGILLASLLISAGCNNSDSDNGNPNEGDVGDAAETQDFNAFVIDLVENQTADNTDPVEINQLSFTQEEDSNAFDTLF